MQAAVAAELFLWQSLAPIVKQPFALSLRFRLPHGAYKITCLKMACGLFLALPAIKCRHITAQFTEKYPAQDASMLYTVINNLCRCASQEVWAF